MIRNYGLLDPTIDFVFKKIFGDKDNRTPLVSLLNAILDGDPKINDVTLKNTEMDKNYPEDKSCKLDLYAVTDDGVYLDIEVQRQDTGELPDRSVYYLSKLVTETTGAGKHYNETRAISIWIMKDNLRKGAMSIRKSAREEIIFCAKPTVYDNEFVPYSNKGRIILVFLNKFEHDKELNDKLKTWIQFFNTPALVDNPNKDEGIIEARKKLDYVSSDDETRLAIDRINDSELIKNSIEYARTRDTIVPIAKRLLEAGMSFEQMADVLKMEPKALRRMMINYEEYLNPEFREKDFEEYLKNICNINKEIKG